MTEPLEPRIMELDPELIAEMKEALQEDAEWEPAIRHLRDRGVSQIESIAVLVRATQRPLSEVKSAVHHSPVWSDRSEQVEKMQQEIEDAVRSAWDGR